MARKTKPKKELEALEIIEKPKEEIIETVKEEVKAEIPKVEEPKKLGSGVFCGRNILGKMCGTEMVLVQGSPSEKIFVCPICNAQTSIMK